MSIKELKKLAKEKGLRIEKTCGGYEIYRGAMRYIGTSRFDTFGGGNLDWVLRFIEEYPKNVYQKGKILSNKQLKEALNEKRFVWLILSHPDPGDSWMNQDEPVIPKKAETGCYLGNTDWDFEDMDDSDPVSDEDISGVFLEVREAIRRKPR